MRDLCAVEEETREVRVGNNNIEVLWSGGNSRLLALCIATRIDIIVYDTIVCSVS